MLGCQIWIERDDSPERIDMLFARASSSGLGLARIFLMWPWIEPSPGEWDFGIWDATFDAAARHGIKIKATLTANSPAWHVPPDQQRAHLHGHNGFRGPEQREPMREYITRCVERYREHPALGQWILWNEPSGGYDRTPETLGLWREFLKHAYGGNVARLNREWLCGFQRFDEIPFTESVTHPIHGPRANWMSYGPWHQDWRFRQSWLVSQLQWIADLVRTLDAQTPLCINPTEVLSNRAGGGTDLRALARITDVIGASYHPAWHFTYTHRENFPALMAAGVRFQRAVPEVRNLEVTEVQCGNTLNSSSRPSSAEPAELARFFLSSIAAGAESVTGWLMNVRSTGFEAGDWGLLDDNDELSARSEMLKRLGERLAFALKQTGRWNAAKPDLWVAHDTASHGLEWVESRVTGSVPGRGDSDGARGASSLVVAALQCGISTTPADLSYMPLNGEAGEAVVCSHVVCWDEATGQRLAKFVEAGGTLLIDATSGRKMLDSTMHRPWPGGMSDLCGFRAAGLQTRPEGWDIALEGNVLGRWLLARAELKLEASAGWEAWDGLRYAVDGEPCVYERRFGRGRLVLVRGMLGPSLVHRPETFAIAKHILRKIARRPEIRPVDNQPHAFSLPVAVDQGKLTAVFAPSLADRGARPLRIAASNSEYLDLWTGLRCRPHAGEIALEAKEGIALIWRR